MVAQKKTAEYAIEKRIPGCQQLRLLTKGVSAVTVAILDGNPDLSLACFEGGNVATHAPYWQEAPQEISREDYRRYWQINDSDSSPEQKREKLLEIFPEKTLLTIVLNEHATSITSIIVGQENSPVSGIASGCRIINIPINSGKQFNELASVLNLVRALEMAVELGANIIHCSICQPSETGKTHPLLLRAIRRCQENNVLVISPTGNDGSKCYCIPATLPGVISVAAIDDNNDVLQFSNRGGYYQQNGIAAIGKKIICAVPGTDRPVTKQGTSVSAPLVTGVAALLASLQLQRHGRMNISAIHDAILETALPINTRDGDASGLRGILHIPGILNKLFTESVPGHRSAVPEVVASAASACGIQSGRSDKSDVDHSAIDMQRADRYVFVLGQVDFDHRSVQKADELRRNLAASYLKSGRQLAPDIFCPREISHHLSDAPGDCELIYWILKSNGVPLYVLQAGDINVDEINAILAQILSLQNTETEEAGLLDHVCVAGYYAGSSVKLSNNVSVPVLLIEDVRGVHGWNAKQLIACTKDNFVNANIDVERLNHAIEHFLNKIYHEFGNDGLGSKNRAMNFSAVNIYQSVAAFFKAFEDGYDYHAFSVNKSQSNRVNGDCWDINLLFADHASPERAHRVFRFIIDVGDVVPVTVGDIKSWTVRSMAV